MAASGTAAALGSIIGLLLVLITVGAIYIYGWRKPPEVSIGQSTVPGQREETVPHRRGGPMYESGVAEAETESVDNDAFDPFGTLALLAIYFLIIGLAWLFMYFVEFLGNGPTVVG